MKREGEARSIWPRVLGYFLAAMVLLTLLSRAADSIMLPVVRCARPLPGALNHTAMLSGVIEAREQLPVKTLPDLAVARVNVRAGQSVKAGDALLSYDAGALSEALRVAERALKQQQLEREKVAGSAAGEPDEGAVQAAELALARAAEDLQAKTDEQERAVRLAEADALEARLALDRAREAHDAALAQAYAAHLKAKEEAYTAVSQELYDARAAMDWAWSGLKDKSKDKYNELQTAVNRAKTRNDEAQAALPDAQLAAQLASDSGNAEEARRVLSDAKEKAEAAAAALDKAQIKRDRIPGAREYVKSRMALEKVQIKYDKANQEYLGAQRRADSVVREIERQCEAKRSAVEDAMSALAEAEKALESAALARDTALRAAKRALKDAEAALAEKQRALNYLKLDVQEKDEAIAGKKDQVDALRQAVSLGGVVSAPADGVVTEVNVKPGDAATGAALRLAPASSGLVVRTAATEDQAEHLRLGIEARFQRLGDALASDGVAVLRGLIPTSTGYEAIFDLPEGGGAIGQAVSITAKQTTETYDTRVPLGAVVNGGESKGVYRIRTGQSVLGEMEYAEFVAVSVIESDAQFAAIDAALSDQDQVVVSSSKPLSANDRVRSSS